MKHNFILHLIIIPLGIMVYNIAFSQNQPVGIFDGHSDVGANVKPGSATFIRATGQYVVSGAGYNVWGDHDEFQYVWKKMKGDFILYTRAEFLGNWVTYHRKVGWMVRKSLDGNSAHVNAVEHGDGLTSLQFRRTTAAQTEEKKFKMTQANILQLERKGDQYIMRAAIYGEPFQTDTIENIELGKEVYVGLFVGSHNSDVLETGVFSNVSISVPFNGVSNQQTPMTLGSNLELLEVASGNREVIYKVLYSIQAPNWTPDGKSLVYCASRDGEYDVYKISSSGGGEVRLTNTKGLDDGPEYSPDGKYIYFNSVRSGTMQIWRMKPDGSDQEQVTNDEFNNWFAHISPDGKWFAYL